MTLDDFVKDGVVKTIAEMPPGSDVGCYYVVQDSSFPTNELYLHDTGAMAIGTRTCNWADINLTPTQLRALSAMCLWAAEQVEKKEKQ